MDFVSACRYMKHGYRVRRSIWAPDSYLKLGVLGELVDYARTESFTIGKDENGNAKTIMHSYISGGWGNDLVVDDMLADDWELITTGIRKEFSKHENGMEYDDDKDWDNYVPTKGGWDFDDDEEI